MRLRLRLRLRPRLCLQAGRDRRERSVMLLFYSNPILSNIKDLEYLFPIQMGGVEDLQLPEPIEAGEPRPVGRPVTFFYQNKFEEVLSIATNCKVEGGM